MHFPRTIHHVARPIALSRQLNSPALRSPVQRIIQCQLRARHDAPRRRTGAHQPSSKPDTYPQNASPQGQVPNEAQFSVQDEAAIRELQGIPQGFQKTRYFRPAIFAVLLSSGIYVGLAFLQARKEEAQPAVQLRAPQIRFSPRSPTPPTPVELATRFYEDLNPISKLSAGIILVNGAVHLSSIVAYRPWESLWHTPAKNVNWTLLTSTFVHSGPFHLLINMWACWNFLLPTGYSPLFEANPYHTLSFFLSTGVLSGYAQHLSTIFSNPVKALQAGTIPSTWVKSGGASGALFGVFGVFCAQYPDAGVGIIFVPITLAASTFLPLVMTFDLIGMLRGFGLGLGHAAHLSGTIIGVSYSYFDGKNTIWEPLVKFWRRQLRRARS